MDTRPLDRPASRANQGRNKKISPPADADSQVRRRRRTAGACPDAISTGPVVAALCTPIEPDPQPPFPRPPVAVATRLIVSFLEVLPVRIKATMDRKRLRQVIADLTALSIEPSGELGDQTVCPSPGLVTMPSRLPFCGRVCAFHPCGWSPSRERFPAGLLSR